MPARRSRAGRRKGTPTAIGSVMGQLLEELGLDTARAAYELAQRWEEAVGADIARHCQPIGIRQGVLEATVDSSVWAQQLQLRRREILSSLQRVLGDEAPTDLRFRVGSLGPGAGAHGSALGSPR